jgi:hypothetical protein
MYSEDIRFKSRSDNKLMLNIFLVFTQPFRNSKINPNRSQLTPVLGPNQPPIQWVPGAFFPGQNDRSVKLTTHQLLCSAEVKNMWVYTSIPPYVSMA